MATSLDSQATRILNLLNIVSLNLEKRVKLGPMAIDKNLEVYLSLLTSTYKDKINLEFEDEGDGIELEAVSRFIFSDKFKSYLEQLELDKVEDVLLSTLSRTKPKLSPAYVRVKKNIKYKEPSVSGKNQQESLLKLQLLINKGLAEEIAKRMGSGDRTNILNYRTGRFATTAFVSRAVLNKAGAINLFYTYMKYPYQTFEQGFEQGQPPSRDPRLLISSSIREIATKLVNNQLRTIRE